ncbi:transcriptional regulator GcvA [Roseovarius sp. ZX-A-9]|uniref:transcriptional regulator GcvA n=1 Tax=Roseovarius sp. ZX-A-9 TaxID=3014783 RepID=UPI00232E2E8D|nr:transcriptional regulator GcvA [Roseovarius sp. ZX-A-9]
MRKFGVQLNALRAFEAAARLSSFSRAAEELCVSHSTISHHILGLEESLGTKLFERKNRRVFLTTSGEKLFPTLKTSFDEIALALDDARSDVPQKVLNVTVTPSFANKWLVPRLWNFQNQHPDVEIRISSSLKKADFKRDGFHVGIRAGFGNWPKLSSELLMPIHMSPVCSPKLLERREALNCPKELLDFKLLHADVSYGVGIKSEWQEWFSAMGLPHINCSGGLSFQDPGLAIQAAINGLGIAIGYVELAEDDIASGRLVRPFAADVEHPWSYYIVTPVDDAASPQSFSFCEWIRTQAAFTQTHR